MKWYNDHDNVVGLARWMEKMDLWVSTAEVIYFMEKPWKWTLEYELWVLYKKQTSPELMMEIVVAATEQRPASTLLAEQKLPMPGLRMFQTLP